MTKEIKEILDDLKKYANEGGEHKLMEYEIKHIQCYITNLQQENEKLKYNARGQVNDYFKNKYADEVLKKADLIKDFELTCYKNYELKKENEFLKLNNPEQNIEHFRIVKENKRKIDNLRKENERLKEELKNRPTVDFTFDVYKDLEELKDYKSRFEKAIKDIGLLMTGNYEYCGTIYLQSSCCNKRLEIIKKDLIGSDE